ncbi:MAG TPA: CS1-pili formation C-terminal domain-containing protein, partial [Sphingomicrobium sp.]|nr:CS1-pili formation C-terminal domain-containing protein [Sphingomicrobium sp.]
TSIGLNALGTGAALDTTSENAIFFPGTVSRLVRGSSRTVVIFGRLVDAAGTPLGGASITSERTSAETDESGNFQMEAGATELRVRTAAGAQCTVDLSGLDMSATFRDLGDLPCRSSE